MRVQVFSPVSPAGAGKVSLSAKTIVIGQLRLTDPQWIGSVAKLVSPSHFQRLALDKRGQRQAALLNPNGGGQS
jgi:hypothetical protein